MFEVPDRLDLREVSAGSPASRLVDRIDASQAGALPGLLSFRWIEAERGHIRGRFDIHRVGAEEAKYKLCRVKQLEMGAKKVPYVVTHDGRTIRYPDPLVAVNDTVKVDIETNKCIDHIKFETGNLAMISGGKNTGRVGVIVSRERHQGSFDIVHVKDSAGHIFATRLGNVFVIGEGTTPAVSLPKRKGIKQTILEERALRARELLVLPRLLLLRACSRNPEVRENCIMS